MSKLAVFDVDGTILDSAGFFHTVLAEYSRANGMPMPCVDTIQKGYGDPHNHDFKWGVPREEQYRHLVNVWDLGDALSITIDGPRKPVLFHGVEPALRRLKAAGHTLAIITSKPEAPLLHLMEFHGIGALFSAVRSWDDVLRRCEEEKPAPDMLLSVMRELNFTPDNTVMIGDTTMDIEMGVRAGTKTIGVTWGSHKKDRLVAAGAHHIVDTDFPEVADAVERVLSPAA